MHIIPYRHYHVSALTIQDGQTEMVGIIEPEYCAALEKAGPAYTVMDGSEVLACAGLAEQWNNRAIAWSLISKNLTGARFIQMHKKVLRFLNSQDYSRIEMTVTHEFEQGHRWARLLGFEWEGLMRKYTPTGGDCDLYARVK